MRRARWSIAVAVVQAVSLTIFFVLYLGKHGRVGVFEILDFGTGIAWIATVATVMLRRGGVLDQGPVPVAV